MAPLHAALHALNRFRRDPVVVQTIRATVAATIAYVIAVHASSQPAPLTAPLTALLVVQVTLFSTVVLSLRRVGAVVSGVVIAIGFSAVVGLSWWSLGLIILCALGVGHLVRVDEFVNEVAISAMLVLGVTKLASQAWDRILETLIGASVGLIFNLVFVPPVWVSTAGEHIEDLARRMRGLLVDCGEELGRTTSVAEAAEHLHEARDLDQAVAEVDEALRQAEDSLRLNPRVSEGLLSRVMLRTGLDTMEICVVVVRVMARSLTDLAKRRDEEKPLFPEEQAEALSDLFTHLGNALVSFAVLVTTQVSANAEEAEDRLAESLRGAWDSRERVAHMLLRQVQDHPEAWQLHGALLAESDRILDELALEHRSQRLLEELDRASAAQREWLSRAARLRRALGIDTILNRARR